jgi:hypothetical protein
MKNCRPIIFAIVFASFFCWAPNAATAAQRWLENTFPPPNGGWLAYAITPDGNPACASYDGRNCLWGQKLGDIDLARVRPLACGGMHLKVFGVTGFEDPKHWCNLALRANSGSNSGAATQTPAPRPPQTAGGYRMTGWSGWGRAADVEYRYRVGWDPATSGPGKLVDAIYEVRNSGSQRWSGAARSLSCEQKTVWGSTDVALMPGQTREVRVRAPNCGNATNPSIGPSVARAGRID